MGARQMEKKLNQYLFLVLMTSLLSLTACSSEEQQRKEASEKAWGQGKYSREKPANQ